ncbi:LamG domain-containing protein [bacterium]|nr:LamG domain-containing protein [bacterium]
MTIKVTRPQIDLREEINKALTTQTLENQDATVKSLVSKGKLDVGGTAKANQYLLEAIDKTKSDSATDVFVYDTSKDSDGGAWRKRTQHTSWYNETLNTATRGSRKDFPAVAVIVLSANAITIYDGDDPEMPMWMIFWRYENGASSGNTTHWNGGGGALTSISALNGHIVLGGYSGGRGFYLIKDKFAVYYTAAGGLYTQGGGLSRRNELYVAWGTADSDYKQINNQSINDVAMTVLPNTPIDADTGLPGPTFALATNGGINVIHGDGSTISITNTQDSSTFNFCQDVQFRSDGGIVWSADSTGNSTAPRFVHVLRKIPTSNFVHSVVANPPNTDEFYARTSTTADLQFISATGLQALKESTGRTNVGTTDGLSSFAYTNGVEAGKGLTNHINTDYNTGWMHGDIKLATSDTDTTSITSGSDLITNGDFTNGTTDWVSSQATVSGGSNKLTLTPDSGVNGGIYQAVTTEVGKSYVARVKVLADTGSLSRLIAAVSNNINDITATNLAAKLNMGEGTHDIKFVATATTTYIWLVVGGGTQQATEFDDARSYVLVDEDRSKNNNGLQVLGTITKTPVATGADLVAYGGFSSSNYLIQPYNSDLDFTGDFCWNLWYYHVAVPQGEYIAFRAPYDNGTPKTELFINVDNTAGVYVNDLGALATPVLSQNEWHHLVAARTNDTLKFYLNGTEVASGTSTVDLTNTNAILAIGLRTTGGYNGINGKVALVRVSATAPTAEQVKKIYKDEKLLFAENAKATLYGTSDAVTALAYDDDTELLHAGTSAGRSVFHGLTRIDNTTAAIGAAISASNGLVAED